MTGAPLTVSAKREFSRLQKDTPLESRVKRRLKSLIEVDFRDHDRQSSIGGSEISCIVGKNPFKTALRLWAEKRRLVAPEDLSDKEQVKAGQILEGFAFRLYCHKYGIDRRLYDRRKVTLIHPLLPWFSFSPDGWRLDLDHGLEIKVVGYRMLDGWGDDGSDQMPDAHRCQVQWGAILTGIKRWRVVAMFGNEIRVLHHTHDPKLARKLLKAARKFWSINVGRRIAPAADAKDAEVLKALHYYRRGVVREATGVESRLLKRYGVVRQQYKILETQKQELENQLKAAVGPDAGVGDGESEFTWRPDKGGNRRISWRDK